MTPTKAVHPRSRGEHLDGPAGLEWVAGPSPLTGEHAIIARYPMAISGPSPLTRGTPRGVIDAVLDDRSIPAHAGNTSAGFLRRSERTVHPRSRGEHSRPAERVRLGCGPSPLTRGTQLAPDLVRLLNRSIPAHAGNTLLQLLTKKVLTVHPRSRGEHRGMRRALFEPYGPSPLTRGTLLAYIIVFKKQFGDPSGYRHNRLTSAAPTACRTRRFCAGRCRGAGAPQTAPDHER